MAPALLCFCQGFTTNARPQRAKHSSRWRAAGKGLVYKQEKDVVSERGDQSFWSSRSSLQGHLLWNQDLLCSQGKGRNDMLGSHTRPMPRVRGLWQRQRSLCAPCWMQSRTTDAGWKLKPDERYFHREFVFSPRAHSEATWSTCAVLAITAFWEDLFASNISSIAEHWPGVAARSPGSQNPLVLPGSEHYSKSTTMNRHSSAREHRGCSNFLLQMHALL